LTIVLFSVITNATFSHTIAQITSRIDISVYLKDSTDRARGEAFAEELRSLPNAQAVTYLSKEQSLERYREQNANNPEVLNAINETDNPLPATIQIKPRDLDKIED